MELLELFAVRQESNVKAKPTAAELAGLGRVSSCCFQVSAVSGCGEVTILQRATGIKSHFEKATKYSIVVAWQTDLAAFGEIS